ncbi:MAG: VOC family protein [Gammaproteobacteria bacterium]|nr:VOC family protein [Gammaproteobacteria bacterium]
MIELGHVVYYVRDLRASLDFYEAVLGLNVVGKVFDDRTAVLTGGRSHHELMLLEVGDTIGPLAGRRIGLYHVGWKIGEDLRDLREARERIARSDYMIDGFSDHTVSQSIYLHDPDGNEVELYIDDPSYDWRHDSSWMETPVKPLAL